MTRIAVKPRQTQELQNGSEPQPGLSELEEGLKTSHGSSFDLADSDHTLLTSMKKVEGIRFDAEGKKIAEYEIKPRDKPSDGSELWGPPKKPTPESAPTPKEGRKSGIEGRQAQQQAGIAAAEKLLGVLKDPNLNGLNEFLPAGPRNVAPSYLQISALYVQSLSHTRDPEERAQIEKGYQAFNKLHGKAIKQLFSGDQTYDLKKDLRDHPELRAETSAALEKFVEVARKIFPRTARSAESSPTAPGSR